MDGVTGVQSPSELTDLRPTEVDQSVKEILRNHARLHVDVEALRDTDDLFRAGMTSLANVNVMLALEEAFDIEFPETMLRRSTFESVAAIRGAVLSLVTEKTPA